ncbi:hypothetical protein HU200_026966 [Digitaria exilis]|uniref:Uncharacterized protein n=1 Tax=Digitaria exilis TaxID=1010633 RepID=A0A835C0A7_9POAL|nr:hypothetical protein HU200_026966 [Digitaria exilis]
MEEGNSGPVHQEDSMEKAIQSASDKVIAIKSLESLRFLCKSLPKTDTFVRLKVSMDNGKLQQGDANNLKALNGNFLDHRNVDRSKPPVVEILGEFTFANRSRGRSLSRT